MADKKQKKQAIQQDPNSFWMIRRKSDGLFSRGGQFYIRWGKDGKLWPTHSRLMAHLKGVDKARAWYQRNNRQLPPHPYLDAEVVQFKRTEEGKADVTGYGE